MCSLSEAAVVYFCLIPVASMHRLILLIAALAAGITLTACGSQSSQSAAVRPPVVLPPAIPSAQPVLLFVGDGASSTDVTAVEGVLNTLGIGYITADSTQLNAMSEPQLGGYKLVIVPGGDSITIGESLTAETSSAIRGAVQDYGVHYLGLCAGAFFGGSSTYNGVDLTAGVPFDFYADEFKGIHEESVELSLPGNSSLDVYWQDGPQLSGWGAVVAKFPDGTPAIVEGQAGKGFVIFTGVHPEAPASWRAQLMFTTPLSVDLQYAGTVVQGALNGSPLPHF
jgi:Biotin-protein ligase, N terminal